MTYTWSIGEDKALSFRKILHDNWKGKLGWEKSVQVPRYAAQPGKRQLSLPLGGFSVCAPAGWGEILFKPYHLIFFFKPLAESGPVASCAKGTPA